MFFINTLTGFKAAIKYTEAGFPAFAVASRSKRPLTPHGFKDATLESSILQSQFAPYPNANVGLRTGGGLLVIDVDGEKGFETLECLERNHGPYPINILYAQAKEGSIFICDMIPLYILHLALA